MKNITSFLMLASVSLLGLQSVANASLVITNDDITPEGKYRYDLSFAGMDPATSTFFSDVYSHSGVQLSTESSWRYVRATTAQSEFVYQFDFSNTSYRPESVDIYGAGRVFGDSTGNYVGSISVYYRIGEEGDWILLRSGNNANLTGTTTSRGFGGADTISLASLPDTFYYKVSYEVEKGTIFDRYQWNRVNANDPNFFSVSFDVVQIPEGANSMIAMGAAGLLAALYLRRRNR